MHQNFRRNSQENIAIKCAAVAFAGFVFFSAFVVFVAVVVFMVCGSCGSWFLRPLGLFWFVGFCSFLAVVFVGLTRFQQVS